MTTRLSVDKAVRVGIGMLGLVINGISIAASPELTRLNACEDISIVLTSLKRTADACEPAAGVIERTIRDFASSHGVTPCFMDRVPVASLSGFRCIQSSYRGGHTLACYRPTSVELLSEYKSNFSSKYSALASTYIVEAKKCPGSNGDASRIMPSTFPPIFMPVAEHEFGFNVQYGDTRPGSALVSHGFARTAPDVARRGTDAIEYVVFANGGMSPELEARTAVGNWRLRVDASSEFANDFLKAIKRQGLEAYLSAVDIDILRAPLAVARTKVPSLPEELSDIIASKLEDEGFEEMSDEELKRNTGRTRQEMRDTVLKGVSFGARGTARRHLPQFRILMKTSGVTCTRRGQGAIGAYLFTLNGEENVQADFGGVATMILGLGACGSTEASSRQYIRNLAQEAKETLLDELKIR
ncbi:hypothetical protein QTH90_31425 [Variovorax sp. J2P1-59]|uniref:hypothetical protein n=1 Tax=Variovorax flavidus TaxID=3053501 RepID=UPI0025755241|nr:hypothetical protein [Variovorax sp. J2P1-59]MDM0078952.1 hypothetical protein [Variovorax sp. J2P1-59]